MRAGSRAFANSWPKRFEADLKWKQASLAGESPACFRRGGLVLTPGKAHEDPEFVEDFLAEKEIADVLPLYLGPRISFLSFCHTLIHKLQG